jgi:hypothetical protein
MFENRFRSLKSSRDFFRAASVPLREVSSFRACVSSRGGTAPLDFYDVQSNTAGKTGGFTGGLFL